MYQFICKVKEGRRLIPLLISQVSRFNKLLDYYSKENVSIKVTIEVVRKDINESQQSLYRAYVNEASKYFGNTYDEMENILIQFHPKNLSRKPIPIEHWDTVLLNKFITDASVVLSQQGFIFK